MGTLYRKRKGGKAYGSYLAKWRDAGGIVRTESTGCKDRSAALSKLAEFERIEERIRAGIVKLLDAAKRRPLHDKKTKNRGEGEAELDKATVAKLEMLGHERALIYRTLALTRLRRGELASITVGNTHLEGDRPRKRGQRFGHQIPAQRGKLRHFRAHKQVSRCLWVLDR